MELPPRVIVGTVVAAAAVLLVQAWKRKPLRNTSGHSVHVLVDRVQVDWEPPFRMLLLGSVGSGKTSLYNRLTGSNERTAAGTSSVTRRVVHRCTRDGLLWVVDTPGFDAKSDKLEHATCVREAMQLKEGFHANFFVTTLGVRTDEAVEQIKRHSGILRPIQKNLFIVFNKVDLAVHQGVKLNDTTKQEYMDAVSDYFDVAGFIFLHHDVDARELQDTFMSCASLCEACAYTFTDFEFAWAFDISRDLTRAERDQLDKLVAEFNDECNIVKERLRNIDVEFRNRDGEKRLFLGDLGVYLNARAEQYVQKFTGIVQGEVTPAVYAEYMSTKKKFMRLLKVVLEELQQRSDRINVQTQTKIRRCPHCGLPWFKAAGCDGPTVCGSRKWESGEAADVPDFGGLSFIFNLDSACGVFTWLRREHKVAATQAATLDSSTKGFGCGKDIVWKDMTPLTVEECAGLDEVDVEDLPRSVEVAKWDGTKFSPSFKQVHGTKRAAVERMRTGMARLRTYQHSKASRTHRK